MPCFFSRVGPSSGLRPGLCCFESFNCVNLWLCSVIRPHRKTFICTHIAKKNIQTIAHPRSCFIFWNLSIIFRSIMMAAALGTVGCAPAGLDPFPWAHHARTPHARAPLTRALLRSAAAAVRQHRPIPRRLRKHGHTEPFFFFDTCSYTVQKPLWTNDIGIYYALNTILPV